MKNEKVKAHCNRVGEESRKTKAQEGRGYSTRGCIGDNEDE